jgi:chemotaxis protein MotB
MAKKKRHHHEEHIDESWLIPYADLLTLLLALFIVLFASSELDAKKFESISRAFSVAFSGGVNMLDMPSPVEPVNPASIEDAEKKQQQQQTKAQDNPEEQQSEQSQQQTPQQLQEMLEQQQREQRETEDMKQLKKNLDKYIEDNDLAEQIEAKLQPDGVKIIIRDLAFFESGSGEVKPAARRLAVALSHLLANYPRKTDISGHTDNVPIHNAQFDSNWDLSSKRATNFLKIILENPNLDPTLFSAIGYGEYQPIAPNDTPENRAKNRRVEVFIHRK